MKTVVQYTRNKPNTVDGYSITVTTTYSSFDSVRIDALEQQFKKTIGYILIHEDKEYHG